MPVGTITNVTAIILGSLIGLLFHEKIPQKIKSIVFQGLGLVTLLLGVQMALKFENFLILIFSVLIGGILGEVINVEGYFAKFGDMVKSKVGSKNDRFTEGMVAASILYCIGPLAILGSINEGIKNDHSLLLTKAILDGFASMAFATTYGIGVLFSAIPVFVFQYGITLLAKQAQVIFSGFVINQLTAVGGVLILGIGLNLLEIKKIKVANFLPALVIAVVLSLIFK